MDPETTCPLILQLSVEILTSILWLVWSGRDVRRWNARRVSHGVATNLALTCHRFSCIVRPFLFSVVDIDVVETRLTKTLHAILHDDPALRLYCRDFKVQVARAQYPIVNDMLMWSTNVRRLSLSGSFNPPRAHTTDQGVRNNSDPTLDMWDLLQTATRHMPRLEDLDCYHRYSQTYCTGIDFVNCIDIPSLKEFRASGFKHHGYSQTPILSKELTASFTSLVVYDCREYPEAVAPLVLWARSLTTFKWYSSINHAPAGIDLRVLQATLLVHKSTLKTLHLTNITCYPPYLFRAADFPNLEELFFSRWLMHQVLDSGQQDAKLLLAPKMRRFVWDFDNNDVFRENWSDFGEEEGKWLGEFAQAVIAGNHPLQTIHIKFEPEQPYYSEDDGYPWDRMDRVRKEMQSFGPELTWTKPIIEREKWLERCQYHERNYGPGRGRGRGI